MANISTINGFQPTPFITIAERSGRIQMSSTTDSYMFVNGGSLGAFYYIWSSTTSTTNLTTLGVPGTTTKIMTAFIGAQGMVRVPFDGTINIEGYVEADAQYTSDDFYTHCWKFSDSYVTNSIIGGTYDSTDTCTLVASATMTTPSSNPHLQPVQFRSTNGVEVSEGDYVFMTTSTNGTTTSGNDYHVIYSKMFMGT